MRHRGGTSCKPSAGPAAKAPRPPRPHPPHLPTSEGERLRETVHGVSAPRPAGAPLASFLVRGGALKGQRLSVKTPVVNIAAG